MFLKNAIFGFRVGKDMYPAYVAVLKIVDKVINLDTDMPPHFTAEFLCFATIMPAANRAMNDANNNVPHRTGTGS